jgi:hypothetical protein
MMSKTLYIGGMETAPNRASDYERRQQRAALRDALPAAVALVVSQVVVVSLDLDADAHPWHLAVSLLPLLPAMWFGWAQWRAVRRADEFQRTAHLEALAVGFGFAMLAALTGGLLDAADVGSTSQWLQITFIGGLLSWVAALFVRLRPFQRC